MELFKMGGVDFTRCITVPNYTIIEKNVYKSWEDANYETHRDIKRTKISGSFSLLFFEEKDFENFLNKQKETFDPNGGFNTITVYVNNLRAQKTIKAYMDVSFPDIEPVIGAKSNKEITVNIEER